MRILIANDGPIGEGNSGERAMELAIGLSGCGHAVRTIDFGASEYRSQRLSLRRVACRRDDPQAELSFDPPVFGTSTGGGQRFADLSDDQRNRLRDTLRQALDQEIDDFDPQIVHCQHVWILGHLALESGVPYVLTAQGEEFTELARDESYRRLAAEAAENAGRLLVASTELADQVQSQFGDLEGRVTVVPALSETTSRPSTELLAELAEIYTHVLDERWGRR